MVELRVLGEVRVADSTGSPLTHVTGRPKRLAVLGYLAVTSARGGRRRDKLLALFWPELDDARARAALNQTLYLLRNELGPEAIESDGSGEVRLSPSAVWCDAVALEEALDAGRAAEALELYRGDLLDGLFVPDAPDFEHWLDAERVRLRKRVSDAAWTVAEAKAGEGDAVGAARLALQAAEWSMGDETEARRLMAFLARLGDRAAALHAYEELRERLAGEYELEPSAETRALAEAIRQETGATATVPMPPRVTAPAAALPGPGAPAGDDTPATPAAVGLGAAPVTSGPSGAPRRRLVRRLLPFMLGLAAVGGYMIRFAPYGDPGPLVRATITFPDQNPLLLAPLHVALSPDGGRLVARGNGGNGVELFLHPMDQAEEVVPLPGTRGAETPFFSPDGAWLGFVRAGTIYRMPSEGGTPVAVAQVGTGGSVFPSWGAGGVIVFHTPAGLWHVPAVGGEAVLFAASDTAHGEWYRFPKLLPDGRTAVFTRVDDEGAHLAVAALGSGEVRDLGLSGSDPLFVPPDRLLYVTLEGAVMTARYDPGAGRLAGSPEPTGERTFVAMMGRAELSASQNGMLAYVPPWPADRALVIVDRSGRAETVRGPPRGFEDPHISPDGRRAVVTVTDARRFDLWLLDLERHVLEPLTTDGISLHGVWSPDGERIAHSFNPGGGMRIAWRGVHGNGRETILGEGRPGQFPTAVAPDGRTLVFVRREPGTGRDIWTLILDGEASPRAYLRTPADERAAVLSPDGRWLAYTSDESGRDEVYVRAFPEPGPATQVSESGGREPQWARDGMVLHYRSQDVMMAADLVPDHPVRVLRREALFDAGAYKESLDGAAYDLLADGRFLMVRRGSEREQVVVVVNWLSRFRAGAR